MASYQQADGISCVVCASCLHCLALTFQCRFGSPSLLCSLQGYLLPVNPMPANKLIANIAAIQQINSPDAAPSRDSAGEEEGNAISNPEPDKTHSGECEIQANWDADTPISYDICLCSHILVNGHVSIARSCK